MTITILAVLSIVSLILGSLFPINRDEYSLNQNFTLAEAKKYGKYEIFAIVPIFLFIGIISFCIYSIGVEIQNLQLAHNSYDFYILPPVVIWFCIGVIFGFGLLIVPMEWLYKFLLREDYEQYIAYTNKKHGYDGMRLMRFVSFFLIPIGLFSMYLCLNYSLIVDDNKLFINKFLSLQPVVYQIDDIQAIKYYQKEVAPNGNIVNNRKYKLTFKDGFEWDTEYFINSDDITSIEPLITHLLAKAKIELEYIEIEQ